jgi:hypothetical protein
MFASTSLAPGYQLDPISDVEKIHHFTNSPLNEPALILIKTVSDINGMRQRRVQRSK